jgi:zinc protease
MKRKTILLALTLAVLTAAGSAAFRKEDVKVHLLDNGLKVLLLEDHGIPNIALYTYFHVGSRNERTGITGVSHFIEHMMFNGTPQIGPGEFDRRMEFAGGANNAFTGDDMTGYTDWFPAAALEPMIVMEADRMQGLLLDPKVLESERGVVASERRMSVENNNDSILSENVRATAIMAHPYHWDVIGWMSDILSWRRDDIMTYYRTYYAPNNAVLIIVGDFEPARALDLIRKYYGAIPKSTPPPAVSTVEPPQIGTKRVVLRKAAQVPSFEMVWHAPAANDPDYFPLAVLEKALLAGQSSRLYKRLVREEQLAVTVRGGVGETLDPQLFTISARPRPTADLDRLEAVIEEELAKIKADGITDAEFQKTLNMIKSDFYFGLQSINGKAGALGQAEILYGGYEKAFDRIDAFAAVKKEQIIQAAKKYFTDANKTVGRLVPEGGAK